MRRDSSVCVALAVEAFGRDKVQVLLLPEKESSSSSLDLGKKVVNSPSGPQEFLACTLELGKPDLVATGVPVAHLIVRADLQDWANRIADWFRDYPRSLS